MTVQSILDGKDGGVISVSPEESVTALVKVLSEARVGAAIVTDDSGRLVGIASERDVVRMLGKHGLSAMEMRVSDVMTAKVKTCEPGDTTDTLMARMTEGRFRHMPVLADGRVVGVVSIGDVVKRRLNDLEFEAEQLKQYITAG